MNDLQIFNNPEFGEVRAMEIDGEPWFVGKDMAVGLGYANPSKAIIGHVDDDDKRFEMLPVADSQNGNLVKTALINESGVYSLIFSSKLERAKEFKHWVTAEVLPSIRKHGAYIAPQAQPPATLDAAALQAFTAAIDTLTATVQTLAQRVDAMERGKGGRRTLPPLRALPTPVKNPFDDDEDNPFAGAPMPPLMARRRWMRIAGDKLDLMANKYGMKNPAILHSLYQYLEEELDVSLSEVRLKVMEDYELTDCTVLAAIFFDDALRGWFEVRVDSYLAPENRGW